MCDIKHSGYIPNDESEETSELRLGVFFDGTNNNKANVQARLENAESYQKYGKKDSSYMNDFSNIKRLWEHYPEKYSIYVEGIGTKDHQEDHTNTGSGFGHGVTGIYAKVEIGCEKVAAKANQYTNLRVLALDVFGFSRGAAAARNFVHEISKSGNHKKNIPPWGYLGRLLKGRVKFLHIRFLGLFDTVSSYHPRISLSPDFSNDVEELHLHDIGKAWYTAHFTAANEHRKHFALTRLPTVENQIPAYIGLEKEFPGEHCDIGGSHNDGIESIKEIDFVDSSDIYLLRLEKKKQQLIEEGWYTDSELNVGRRISGVASHRALDGQRNLVKTYSYIPLHFMAELGVDEKEVPFNLGRIKSTYSIEGDALLERVEARLRSYVIDGRADRYTFIPAIPGKELDQEQKDLRVLRNKYLHWSSHYEGYWDVMIPTKDRERIIYE